MAGSEIIIEGPAWHRHGDGLGTARTGSVARCACGKLLVYRGSESGRIGWHPATWRERRRIARRLR